MKKYFLSFLLLVCADANLFAQATDYSGATWYTANSTRYFSANRPNDAASGVVYTKCQSDSCTSFSSCTAPNVSDVGVQCSNPIDNMSCDSGIWGVIIHDMEGYYLGTIDEFEAAGNTTVGFSSAHYLVPSYTSSSSAVPAGQVAQMVLEKNIAYQAGNSCYNSNMVGVEHEGFETQCWWYTEAMYEASAALVVNICQRNNIPIDPCHIFAHGAVPCQKNNHTDPGPNWDWIRYMDLLHGNTFDSELLILNAPVTVTPGQAFTVTVQLQNTDSQGSSTGRATWEPDIFPCISPPTDIDAAETFDYNLQAATGGFPASDFGATDKNFLTSNVIPGTNVTFTLNCTAPTTPGTYVSCWQMQDRNGNFFGAQAYFTVVVSGNTPTSTATNTLTTTTSVTATNTVTNTATATPVVARSLQECFRA